MTGSRFAHYQIDAELGRGGMGIVYRAHDTKLDRTVALKVLPAHALSSEDDRARFQREARAAAKLHHAHIASIFEIGEAVPEDAPHGSEPRPFIAMEYVDGESLADRIVRGPLKLEEAIRIASETAVALGVAHEAGIVHRDVKSGNVMLSAKGEVKVLDFGLAKTGASTQLTRQGSTLGTVAYMSPEQARAEEVDHRTDLWALGVMLYEMVAGRLPFAADYEQAALYGILNEDPEPLTALRTGVPMELERIVGKLLEKDRDRRYPGVDALLVDLRAVELPDSSRAAMRRSSGASDAAPIRSGSAGTDRRFVFGVLAGAAVACIAWLAWSLFSTAPPPDSSPPLRLSLLLDSREPPAHIAMSPDGSKLAYVTDRVYVVDLETGAETVLDGTENTAVTEFSPDGRQLLLTKATSIERIPVAGGRSLTVVEAREGGPRASWGPDGWIIYEDDQAVFRYSESTGERFLVSRPDTAAGETDYDWPRIMPDGETVMATIEAGDAPPRLRFIDFETGETRATVNFAAYGVRWLPTGHLVGTVDEAGLVIVPFDADRLQITGERRAVAPVASANHFATSAGGSLVYSEEDPLGAFTTVRSRPGVITFPDFRVPLPIPVGIYSDFRLSPDESRLAYIQHGGEGTGTRQRSLWVFDIESRQARQVAANGRVGYPAWTPDGDSVLYVRTEILGQATSLHIRAADGSGEERRLDAGRANTGVARYLDLSPDGSSLVLVATTGSELGVLLHVDTASGDITAVAGADGGSSISEPRINPDGRFVAYRENESIMIRAMDGSGVPLNMSRGFAQYPRWVRGGDGFHVVSLLGGVFEYDVAAGPSSGRADYRELGVLGQVVPYYEPFDDGRRAVIAYEIESEVAADTINTVGYPLSFVVNWFDELNGTDE